MKARVYVTLKPSVFDPQGRVVADALVTLGYPDVTDVRQGKFFEVELADADPATAEARVAFAGQAVAVVRASVSGSGEQDELAEESA